MLAPLESPPRSDSSYALQAQAASGADAGWGHARCTRAYWPAHALNEFLLRMASHGRCVSAAMMLGDCSYAALQLERAKAIPGDMALQALVSQLSSYFTPMPLPKGGGDPQRDAAGRSAGVGCVASASSSYERMGSGPQDRVTSGV